MGKKENPKVISTMEFEKDTEEGEIPLPKVPKHKGYHFSWNNIIMDCVQEFVLLL